jgi:hypothetical protein
MARRKFWTGPTDYVVNNTTGVPIAGAQVTFYNAKTGGAQVTDIRLMDSAGADAGAPTPASTLTTNGQGFWPDFLGPTDGTSQLWASCTSFPSRLMVNADLEANAGDASTVLAGDGSLLPISSNFTAPGHTHIVNELPAGAVLYRRYTGSSWPARGTTRTDVTVIWVTVTAADPNPAIDSTFALNNVDLLLRRT